MTIRTLHFTGAILLITLLPVSMGSTAQESTEREAILATIDEFFEAMTARDASQLSALTIQGSLSIWAANPPEEKELNLINYTQMISRFSAEGPVLLERYWDPTVLVEGNIAVFWAPYDFHIDGEFSHCGIDSFQLVKREGKWLISNLSWTRQRENCEPSPLGPV